MSVDQNMMCPRCGTFQKKSETCSECGLLIEKVSPIQNKDEENIDKVVLRGRKTKDSDPWGWFRATRAVLWVLGICVILMFYFDFFKGMPGLAKKIIELKLVQPSSETRKIQEIMDRQTQL